MACRFRTILEFNRHCLIGAFHQKSGVKLPMISLRGLSPAVANLERKRKTAGSAQTVQTVRVI